MPLYSTGTQTKAGVGKLDNGLEIISNPEVKNCAEIKEAASWCYLFIHHTKVEAVSRKLEEKYRVFIHKSIVYKRENKRIRKEEQPTISGLVFVQGNDMDIQNFLTGNFSRLYLAKDYSAKRVAVIPDSVMQPFMRVSEVEPTRIRFLPHTFDYYSDGNQLIRITSGVLSGLEGYRIRIARDKCLITSIGGMAIAISGIHRESFENLDEYVRQRREQLRCERESSYVTFTPLQTEIDSCFFTPQSPLDIMAIAEGLIPWTMRLKSDLTKKSFDEAVEIALFVLEEVGICFRNLYADPRIGDMRSILTVCREADKALLTVMNSEDISTDLKEIVASGRESLAIRFPFLPIEL